MSNTCKSKKYFISQAMNGRTDDEIKRERDIVIEAIKKMDENAIIIDSIIKVNDVRNPLWYVGVSLKMLAYADEFVSVGCCFETNRGCKIEHDAAIAYGIPTSVYVKQTGHII